MIPNIFSLLGESIVGKHIAKGIIFSNSPKKFHPNGSRIQDIIRNRLLKISSPRACFFIFYATSSVSSLKSTGGSHPKIDFASCLDSMVLSTGSYAAMTIPAVNVYLAVLYPKSSSANS